MKPLRLIPLGGLGEIGMNCMAFEYDDEIIVVDCGLLFTDLDVFGIDFVIPNLEYLLKNKEKVKGFVITHGHEDHIGALPFAHRFGIRAPVFMSEFCHSLVSARLEEQGLMERASLKRFKLGDTIEFKHFKFKTMPVNHSIVEAVALFIDTPVGKIIHTGDFKIDSDPYYGKTLSLEPFENAGDEGVLLLLSDSTNIERTSDNPSEKTVFDNLKREIDANKGLTILTMFSSNIARMGQIFEIADQLGKKVATTGRSIADNIVHARELGYLKHAEKTLVDIAELENFDRDRVVVIASGSQGEFGSALRRISVGEHKFVDLQQNDRVLMSSRFIPGNELAIHRLIDELYRKGAEVVYEALHEIHSSGHATQAELRKMIEAVRPKFFIPVHGEYRFLVHHCALAKECGVENARVTVNGEIIEITPDEMNAVDRLEDVGVLVESSGNTIPKEVLKQRRKLAENGVVFAGVGSDEAHQIVASGVCGSDLADWLHEEAREKIGETVAEQGADLTEEKLLEAVRIEVRRFYNQNIGKKPVVFPTFLKSKR